MATLSPEEFAACKANGILPEALPSHIAIVMDGNGRWAKKRFMPRIVGHRNGAESLRTTIKTCADLGVQFLSVYVFSTENWKRPEDEVSFLMGFIREMLIQETPKLHEQNIKIRVLGDIAELSPELQAQIQESEGITAANTRLQFNLLINYGSRREIVQAIQKIAQDAAAGTLSMIDDQAVSDRLYSSGIPDPDIMIRTGGDSRISNFLLWQCAYSELFFLDILWPDFDRAQLLDVIIQFQKRDRRFGGIK
jgi:undecaprenyl diphosphate synthase